MCALQPVQVDVERIALVVVVAAILHVTLTVQTDVVVAVCSAAIQLVKNRVPHYVLIHVWAHAHMNALVQKVRHLVKDRACLHVLELVFLQRSHSRTQPIQLIL